MDYESFFRGQVDGLKREGRYRVFADLERRAGAFPRAKHHSPRGENEVTLQFELLGAPVKYHGSLTGAKTIVGEMQMPHDTVHVTLTKK